MSLIKNSQYLTRHELLPQQQKAWEKQRRYVSSNSAFFQQLWDGQAPPNDLRDLPELPLSSKTELRLSQESHPPFGNYIAAEQREVSRLHRTSGTTGQAMNLALSAKDAHITEVIGGRCQAAAGLTPDHKVVHCLNYQLWMGGLTDHMTLEKTGAMVVPFGVGNTEQLIRTILEIGIDAISCTPSYPAVIEKVLAEKFPDLKPKDLGLKLGLFGGEAGLDDIQLRTRLKDTWGMEPRNANYGVTDVFCNFAGQCTQDHRLHFMAMDVLYPELIDPETAAPLPFEAGQQGELVLTHLARDCQPLVRFRTGDIITLDETEPCSCGRKTPRFRVIGRSDDMVVIRGLNLFPTMVAAIVNEFKELSGDYRILLDSKPPYDFLPLHVELQRGQAHSPALAQVLEKIMKEKLGASAKVTLLPHGSLPLSEGKTKRVIRSYE
jgi:phenylacetate-CoA ligase